MTETQNNQNSEIAVPRKKTRVVHISQDHEVYIARPSKYGNPFSHQGDSIAKFKTASRKESVEKYREWLKTQPELIEDMKKELKGKVLGCFCYPGQRCHGQVIIDMIDPDIPVSKPLF